MQLVSESLFTVRGHGVHSTFEDHVRFLTEQRNVETAVNGLPRQSFDIVHVHTVGPYSLLFLLHGDGRKVATAHITADSLIESIVGAQRLHRFVRWYLRWFYNHSDIVIAVSEQAAIELRQAGVTKPVKVLRNLVRCEDIDAVRGQRVKVRRRLGIDESEVLVVSVGQVQPRKGVLEFIACAKEMPEIRFLWVGGAIFGAASAGKSHLESAFQAAPPNVQLAGSVTRDQVFEYLAAADIYLSLSRQETFGLAVLEAAAASCPLVLSELPVFRATYCEAAQYIGADGPVTLITELAKDESLRRDWGRLARKVAVEHDWRDNGESLMSAYQELTGQDGKPVQSSQ